jgi:Ca2+-binding EF-hand superfamily protein
MLKKNEIALWILIIMLLFAGSSSVETAFAQKKTPDAPKQNSIALGEDEVKQLLLLMDTDKNGKISKKEYMAFMEAEFNRLDTDKSGELDAKELTQSQMRVSRPPVGK